MGDANNSTEVAAAPVATASPAAKKTKSTKVAVAKKPSVKPSHPPTAEMVNNAIKTLKERGGSSLQAIKKYISSNYKIDAEKLAPFIKKYLKGAVTGGQLVQTKGKGASGSFKIGASAKKDKSEIKRKPKVTTKKPAGEKKPKKEKTKAAAVGAKVAVIKKKSKKTITSVAKKPATSSASVEKKKAAVATAKAAKKSGTVKSASPKQKPTKATKSPVKQPKAPKPKKVAAPKKTVSAPKKAAASKAK